MDDYFGYSDRMKQIRLVTLKSGPGPSPSQNVNRKNYLTVHHPGSIEVIKTYLSTDPEPTIKLPNLTQFKIAHEQQPLGGRLVLRRKGDERNLYSEIRISGSPLSIKQDQAKNDLNLMIAQRESVNELIVDVTVRDGNIDSDESKRKRPTIPPLPPFGSRPGPRMGTPHPPSLGGFRYCL